MTTRKSRGRLLWLGAVAITGMGGCASPERVQESAYRNEMRAQQLQAQGDYVGAEKAREAAAKERAKAAERSTWY